MDNELKKKVDKANEEMVVEAPQKAVEEPGTLKLVDYYQAMRNAAYTASQSPTVHGTPAALPIIVDKMVESFKQTDYNVNRNQYDHLIEYDAKSTAENLRQGYLVNEFFPLVESIVENYGVDALLNSPKALAKLDEVAITPNGSGGGFTKGYLKQMHKGQTATPSKSDVEIAYGIAKAKQMAGDGNIRGGVGAVKKLKEKVDKGELSASDSDYEILSRISSYAK